MWLREEISTRPNQFERVEYWECLDASGNFNKAHASFLLKSRRRNKSGKSKQINHRARKEIAQKYNLPDNMIDLWIGEVKLGNGIEDENRTLEILGL